MGKTRRTPRIPNVKHRRLSPRRKQPQKQPAKHHDDEAVLKAIKGSYGIIANIARRLKLRSPQELRSRIKKNKVLDAALRDERLRLLGLAEDGNVALIKALDYRSIQSTLVNFGRDEGWKDEKTIKFEENKNIDVEIVGGDDLAETDPDAAE